MAAAWVYAEVGPDGRLDPASLGLLAKARVIAGDVAAVVLGPGARAAVEQLGAHGAGTVFVCDDALFAEFPGEPSAFVLGELVREHAPALVLFGPSYDSRDVAARLQAILGVSLVAGVDDVLAADRVRVSVALSLWPGRPGQPERGRRRDEARRGGARTAAGSASSPAAGRSPRRLAVAPRRSSRSTCRCRRRVAG